jgi:hypothetical protein
MRVRVTVDAVVLTGVRVHPGDRAALLARLEAQLTDQITAQLSGLPAQTWAWPADAITAPVQAAVTDALVVRPAGAHGVRPAGGRAGPAHGVRPSSGGGSWV